ncbi:Structural constituent of ribosome [Hibiscus syriacus]|uniref:Structural constituent of ribosome n=1 Tax=Hibiscus syriacus TaxID=106335 RepID=A0A6A2XTQ7_HIBSY|nr:Structural constituent of ribosome [Hibiscus syriacus]
MALASLQSLPIHSPSPPSRAALHPPLSTPAIVVIVVPPNHLLESSRPHDPGSLNYALANPNGKSLLAYKVYWTSCVTGIHTGNMVLPLAEAIDVYLAGSVMLIFGMGLSGLFISNSNPELPSNVDRALRGSSLLGMFAMKERPKWMKISSLDELKTKVGHVIVMILLVKMFERSKMVAINTGMDLLTYSICIFLSSASLYILHHLHKPE